MRKLASSIAVVSLSLVLVAGCGSDDEEPTATGTGAGTTAATTTAPAGAPATGEVQVAIKGFAYGPETITVKVGTKVTWTNEDSAVHDVVSDTEGVVDSGDIKKGTSFSMTFDKVGEVTYYCSYHQYMKAKVVVVA